MPYKISGTKSETGRVMVLKESDWSIEANTVVSGSGDYEITELESGSKLVFSRAEDGEVVGYGTVAAESYVSRGLYAWGYNNYGQLGVGDTSSRTSPVQVGSLTDWQTLTMGWVYAFAVKTDGTLWAWGRNHVGQLGLGHTSPDRYSSPVQVGGLTDWSTITCSCQDYDIFATKTDGTLWSWGLGNVYGQLGLGDVSVSYSTPQQVGGLEDWSKVSSGRYHVLALKTDGTLWTWGRNENGELGLGHISPAMYSSPVQIGALTTWEDIITNYYGAYALKSDGTLWSWGYNGDGQLGLGDTNPRSSPVQVGSNYSDVIGGSFNSCFGIKTDGTLWTWGRNDYGQLGLGDITARSTPTKVGLLTNWAVDNLGSQNASANMVKTDGTLWDWGYNGYYDLGQSDIVDRSSPTQVGSDTDWILAAMSGDAGVGIKG
jgi:alpha-tubulin suppressor-like RCC1 family protein